MKYRIVRAGRCFHTQCKYRFWPFWVLVFNAGHNHFSTIDEAERAIRAVINNTHTDGQVVKEFTSSEGTEQ